MSPSAEDAHTSLRHLMEVQIGMMATSAAAMDLVTVNHTLLELVERLAKQNCAPENRRAAAAEVVKIAFHAVRISNAYLDAYDALQNTVEDFTASLRENIGALEKDFLAVVDTAGSA